MTALRGGSYDVIARTETFIVIWWVVAGAMAFGVLPHRRWPPALRIALAALLALAAWTGLGLLWTDSAERTVREVVRVLGYAGLVLLLAWLFGRRDRVLVVGVLTVVSGAVCMLTLLSRLVPGTLTSALARSGFDAARLDYPFNYWNALGCWAAMTMALGLGLAAHAGARWVRATALAVASLALVVVYLTYSRTATISVILAVVLVVALSARRWLAAAQALTATAAAAGVVLVIRANPEIARGTGTGGRESVALALCAAVLLTTIAALHLHHAALADVRIPGRTWWRRIVPAAVGACLVLGVTAGPGVSGEVWDSFHARETPLHGDPAERLTSLGGARSSHWAVALSLFADEPLHGIGAGTYEFAWNQDPGRTGHVIDAHSLYLEALAELGVPGLLLIALALGALLVAALRGAAGQGEGAARGAAVGCAAAFAVFCVTAGVDWMWESTAVACFALAVGTIAAAGDRMAAARRRWWPRAGGAATALAVILLQVPVLVGAAQIRSSRAASARGEFVTALADATAATQSQPWAASGHLQRALVLEQIGRLPNAAEAAHRATELEPTNWELWLALGRIEAERGRLTPALSAIARSRALNPRSPLFRRGAAVELDRRRGG